MLEYPAGDELEAEEPAAVLELPLPEVPVAPATLELLPAEEEVELEDDEPPPLPPLTAQLPVTIPLVSSVALSGSLRLELPT